MRRWAILAALGFVACGGGDDVRVSGEHGYVRCLALEPPASRTWSVGSLRLTLEGRSLRIEGLKPNAELAVFTGPVEEHAVRSLERPALALMMGELGASRAEAERSLETLMHLEVPVLFVAGGADTHEGLEAFGRLEGAARDRLIDASRLRSIEIGKLELVPVAGAPEGRYASSESSCGFGDKDASAIAAALGRVQEGRSRLLLSWAAPAGDALSRGLMGAEAGSSMVAELVERIGAEGWIAAWPSGNAGETRTEPLRAVVRPLGERWIERDDGTRAAPGATLFTVAENGHTLAPRGP